MSDEQPVTIDDVWVNRLAQRMGILMAQNERLIIENESLTNQLQQLQEQPLEKSEPAFMNGERVGSVVQ